MIISTSLHVIFVIFIYIHLFTMWVDIGVLIHLIIHEIVCDISFYMFVTSSHRIKI